jgi:photosystem II stability/assembly factor-like uncharacterized protein
MSRNSFLFIVGCWLALKGICSLDACDRYALSRCPQPISSEFLQASGKIPNIYNGGWGFPQSADVCTYDAECFPWRSGNGKYLLFASINFAGPPRPGHQGTQNWDIYISEWDSIRQCWGEEKNMGPVINTLAQERRPSCTWNCDTLYFNRREGTGDEDIYLSTFNGINWSAPVALPDPVNTSYNDEHPAISADGKRLYFTSDRPGGMGGSDIWIARWDGSSWSLVLNFGPPVNTFNEESRPFESYDGQRFYFTNQYGYPRVEGSYGAGDIYVCTRSGSGWGPVQVVAAPVNCDLVACSPYETPEGNELWIGSESWEGAHGDEDIWVSSKNNNYSSRIEPGYGAWMKTGELEKAIYVYDLKEGPSGIIYAAAACTEDQPKGKIFKTHDGGLTWTACAELPGTMVVYSVIVRGDTIYAGTYPNGDIFKSTDRGNSWTNTQDIPGAKSIRAMIRLKNGDLLAGASPPDLSNRSGIFRTSNGGLTWNETARLPHLNPCKFICQTSRGAIFTGGWSTTTGVLIYRSMDNGTRWDTLTVISDAQCDWSADRLMEARDGTLFLSGWIPSRGPGENGGYVYQSIDQGDSWDACAKIMRGDGVHSDRVYSIMEDRAGVLYAGIQPAADSVVFASKDRGKSWYPTGGLLGAFECLCLLEASNGMIYAGTTPHGDVFKFNPITPVENSRHADAAQHRLTQNYPNPFNSSTAIRFQTAKPGRVIICILNLHGQLVKALFDRSVESGWHVVQFNGADEKGRPLAAGLYFYRMETVDYVDTKKFLLLK